MTLQVQPHRQFTTSCALCGGTGWVNAIHRILHNHYAFRCGKCGSGGRYSKQIPEWSENHKKTYELFSNYFARSGWKGAGEITKAAEKEDA